MSSAPRGVASVNAWTLATVVTGRDRTLGHRNQFLGLGANRTRLGLSRRDTPVSEQIADQVASQRLTLIFAPPELFACYIVSHNGQIPRRP